MTPFCHACFQEAGPRSSRSNGHTRRCSAIVAGVLAVGNSPTRRGYRVISHSPANRSILHRHVYPGLKPGSVGHTWCGEHVRLLESRKRCHGTFKRTLIRAPIRHLARSRITFLNGCCRLSPLGFLAPQDTYAGKNTG